MRLFLPSLLLLVACGSEPPAAPTTPPPGPATGGAEATAPTPAAPPAEGGDAMAAAPPPAEGAEGAAPPPTEGGDAPPPPEGDPTAPSLAPESGPGVKLSGTIAYDGALKMPIRIDLLQKSADDPENSMGRVVHTDQVSQAGPWSIAVKEGAGDLTLSFFIDMDGNGPSDNEPSALIKGVQVGTAAVSGLDVTLTDPPGMIPPEGGVQGPPVDQMGGKKGDNPAGGG